LQTMTREQERLLRQLVELAGDPVIVQDALKQLAEEENPTLEKLVRRILELKRSAVPA
jgi:hypothetical protein